MEKRYVIAFALALSLVPAAVLGYSSEVNKQLADVRQATVQYHDVDKAIEAGYVQASPCVSSPEGGMGIHFVNMQLTNAGLDLLHPNVLLYEPTKSGKLKLVGVEYLYPQAMYPEAPELFGMPLDTMAPHDGIPFPHYERHAFIWQANPLGTFYEWNPNVKCSEA